ncbi:MAG: hypothetical protein R2883_07660 [Caldisericia bacterium]
MVTVEFKGNYDKNKNLSIFKYINTPKSKEDIEFVVERATPLWKGDGIHKSWNITDITALGQAPPSLVIYYNKLCKPILKKHVHNYVVIAGTLLEKVATSLFNTFMGEKHPVVSSMEEALEMIEKLQARDGVFPGKAENL